VLLSGRAAWIYALHNPKLKADVSYYDLLGGMKSPIKPRDPVEFGAELKVPVLGCYAGIDAFIKPEVIAKMRSEIAKSTSGS
jgi:carboxymethylenebutenolidase